MQIHTCTVKGAAQTNFSVVLSFWITDVYIYIYIYIYNHTCHHHQPLFTDSWSMWC